MLNPLGLLAAILGALLDRFAPRPRPLPGVPRRDDVYAAPAAPEAEPQGADVLPFPAHRARSAPDDAPLAGARS